MIIKGVNYRSLPNGSIYAPHRGKAPTCPDGYYRDKGDQYMFHIIIKDCEYRTMKFVGKKCCGSSRMWCTRDDLVTNNKLCKECEDLDTI